MIRITDITRLVPDIYEQIQDIIDKTGSDWPVYYFIEKCVDNEWMLFSDDYGWIMVRFWKNQFTGNKTLEVMAAWYRGGDGLTAQYPFLLMLAKETGCPVIEMRSSRKGWERRGFIPVETVYRMEVQNGLDV